MNPIRKTVYTLNIDNYAPGICALTYPLMQAYADKIGAQFHIITGRTFPAWPVVYEKMQIKTLGAAMGNDWNIYFDSDALIHPETPDWTTMIGKDTVLHNGHDFASVRWSYSDPYFLRDGRHIGSCNWFTIASDWCLDLWTPLDIPIDDALDNIHPIPAELKAGITKHHLIDDYTLSRNIARYGLKFAQASDLCEKHGLTGASFFFHQYTIPEDEKMLSIRQMIARWGL